MPEKKTIDRAREDARQGKSPSTQAGEFVYEKKKQKTEREDRAQPTKEATPNGLAKAPRAGIKLPPPKEGKASERVRAQAKRDEAKGRKSPGQAPAPKRSRAITAALQREGGAAASHAALSRQAHASARIRGAASRSRAAAKAARTKGTEGLKRAARKAARTRAARNR